MLRSGIILTVVLGLAVGLDVRELMNRVYRVGIGNSHFAVNLHKELAEGTNGNVFFSPFSVASVLTMLYKGARGKTAQELRRVLGYGIVEANSEEVFTAYEFYLNSILARMDTKAYTINCVSAMLIDNTFPVSPGFKSEMQDVFQAYVEDVNMAQESAAAVDRMNTWAKIKSKGNIDCLADSVDPETSIFLASAAYFKGAWTAKFDEKDTKLHPFYNGGVRSNVSNVWMMHAYPSVRYFEEYDEDFTAVELFYEGRDISMVIYLPTRINGLYNLEKQLTAQTLTQVRRRMYITRVHLTMPKFKLQMDRSLTRPLKNIGLNKIFSLRANFTGMVPRGSSLYIDDIKHKATIEVNEKGSVAAAITRAVMIKSMPSLTPEPEFKVNHPFLFALFDTRTDMVLFMGRINQLKNQAV